MRATHHSRKSVILPLLWAGLLFTVRCAAGPVLPASGAEHEAQISEGPQLPLAVAGHAGGLVDGLPVVAGGSSWPLDPKTGEKFKKWQEECFIFRDGKWLRGPSLPNPLSDSAYASGPDGLYVAGGVHGKDEMDGVFHLGSATAYASWHSLPSLPQPVEGATGAFAGGKFYVFGGFSDGKISSSLQALDVNGAHPVWKSLAPLPALGRAFSALVAADSGLYLFGGVVYPPYQKTTAIFADVYRYDIAQDRWQLVQGLNLPGYGWTATVVNGQQIMLTGRVPALERVSDEILLVNLETLHVNLIGRMVTPACCMPAIQTSPQSWWLPGGEPSTTAIRTARTTIVSLEFKTDQ